jgi:hypothetical protein
MPLAAHSLPCCNALSVHFVSRSTRPIQLTPMSNPIFPTLNLIYNTLSVHPATPRAKQKHGLEQYLFSTTATTATTSHHQPPPATTSATVLRSGRLTQYLMGRRDVKA